MGKQYLPLYAVLALGLVLAIFWYERAIVEETPQISAPAIKPRNRRRSIWAFMPPVSYVLME
jgi:hypothetical protein